MRSANRSMAWVRMMLLGAALVSGSSACSVLGVDDFDEERENLDAARSRWLGQGIDSYSFVLRRLCFCAGGVDPATVLVRSRQRISVTVVATGEAVPDQFTQYYLTVDELFAFIEDAMDQNAHSVRVTYHAGLGYPTSIAIDFIENAIDDEMAFEASALLPLR